MYVRAPMRHVAACAQNGMLLPGLSDPWLKQGEQRVRVGDWLDLVVSVLGFGRCKDPRIAALWAG